MQGKNKYIETLQTKAAMKNTNCFKVNEHSCEMFECRIYLERRIIRLVKVSKRCIKWRSLIRDASNGFFPPRPCCRETLGPTIVVSRELSQTLLVLRLSTSFLSRLVIPSSWSESQYRSALSDFNSFVLVD